MNRAVVTCKWFAAVVALTLGLSGSIEASEVFVVPADPATNLRFVRKLTEDVEARIVAFARWRPPQQRWATADKLDHRQRPFPHGYQRWELDNLTVLGRYCLASELGDGTSVSTLLPGRELLRKSTFSRTLVNSGQPKGEFFEVAVLFRNIGSEWINYAFSSGPCSNLDVNVELSDGTKILPRDFLLPAVAGSFPDDIRRLHKKGRAFVSDLALPEGGTIGFTLPPYRIQRGQSLNIHDSGRLPDEPIQGAFPVNRDGTVNLDFGYTTEMQFPEEEQPREVPRNKYGSVFVSGMTLDDAITAMNIHLQDYLEPPGVSVSLDVSGMPGEYLPRVGASTCVLFLFDVPRKLATVQLRIKDAPLVEIPRRLLR